MKGFVAVLIVLMHVLTSVALRNSFARAAVGGKTTSSSSSSSSGETLRSLSALGMVNEKWPIENDLIIRAAKGEKVERTPVWVFRQAGRHLPEYNDYKKAKGKNFLQMLDDPVDVAECTMQPIRRYNLDAAILFSDILVILQALGMEVTMPGGVGIQVPKPLAHPSEVEKRLPKSVDIEKELKHVLQAVVLIKSELKGKVPLIGFSAAPWTLMYYAVGGSSKRNQEIASGWLDSHPDESQKLLDLLTDTVIEYMSAQIEAGADLMQIFEAMGEFIDEEKFFKWCLPCLKKIASELRARHPTVPLLVFPRGATYALKEMQEAGYDVVTLDTKTSRIDIRKILADNAKATKPPHGRMSGVQGNLDVAVLKGGADNTEEDVEEAVRKMLSELGPQQLIANLGEGLTGKEDPVLVAKFIDSVHSISEQMIAGSA